MQCVKVRFRENKSLRSYIELKFALAVQKASSFGIRKATLAFLNYLSDLALRSSADQLSGFHEAEWFKPFGQLKVSTSLKSQRE